MIQDSYTVGIDEVGRGALAGPVVVAAVLLPSRFRIALKMKLRDSKRLSPWQREIWARYIQKQPDIVFATARVYPRTIEKINITASANRAATRAFLKLSCACPGVLVGEGRVLLDGGLFLETNILVANGCLLRPQTIIKGDEKIKAIQMASIIAKVTRDRYMVKLAGHYPDYAFGQHKGYGTRRHVRVLLQRGPIDAHRLTFIG